VLKSTLKLCNLLLKFCNSIGSVPAHLCGVNKKLIINKLKTINMKKLLMIMILAVTAGITTTSAQQPAIVVSDKTGWHKIGETTVDFKKETDEVVVMGSDRFASIKFKVTDAPIDIVSIKVYYESGDAQSVSTLMKIDAPGESKTIDLNGGERTLKKIVFVYKTLPNRKDVKAHVEIWGLKTNTDKK
jgi:hypothetical protein